METVKYPLAYGCKNKSEDVRSASRSGGVFTAISDKILDSGGVVYGCALNENFEAVHKRATTKAQRDAFRGSKYVQSDLGDTFNSVREDLKSGIAVMFSGTPCQVDGLKRFLELTHTDTANLVTVVLICHGVPSPRVWRDYLKYRSKRAKSPVAAVDFRNKAAFGWKNHVETVAFENGKTVSSKKYTDLFLSDYIIRRSCHECKYTSKARVSEITLGDFWGIDSLAPDFNDDKGVSLILVNNEKGNKLFSSVADALTVKQFDLNTVNQSALNHPHGYKPKREEFWSDYNANGIEFVMDKYVVKNSLFYKLKELVRSFMH